MGHYDDCRPGYCGGCGAGPGNLRLDGSCPFCSPRPARRKATPENPPSSDELLSEWQDAYRAFIGAFDTPIARRKTPDEYSSDARARLRAFDERFTIFAKAVLK